MRSVHIDIERGRFADLPNPPLQTQCALCLEDFDDDDLAFRMKRCNHLFHTSCWVPNAQPGKNSCSLCPPPIRYEQLLIRRMLHTERDVGEDKAHLSDGMSGNSGGGMHTISEGSNVPQARDTRDALLPSERKCTKIFAAAIFGFIAYLGSKSFRS